MDGDWVVYKYVIPVDDEVHYVRAGRVVHAEAFAADAVTIWVEHPPPFMGVEVKVAVVVIGTGQPYPSTKPVASSWVHAATAVFGGGSLVWHVLTGRTHV